MQARLEECRVGGLEVTFQFPDNDVLLALSELSEIGMDFAAVWSGWDEIQYLQGHGSLLEKRGMLSSSEGRDLARGVEVSVFWNLILESKKIT